MTGGGESTPGEVARAGHLCDLSRFDEAVATIRTCLAVEPNSVDAWCILGRARIGQGEFALALDAGRQAASHAPEEEWPYRIQSVALSNLGERDAAVRAAREAVRLAPMQWITHSVLADALVIAKAGQQESSKGEARRAAEEAVRLAPLDARTHQVVARVARADGRRDEAEAAIRRALDIDPQSSVALHQLAVLRTPRWTWSPAAMGEAATGFAAAVRSDPRSSTGRRNLEMVLRRFVRLVAYLVLVDAFLLGLAVDKSASVAARIVPLIVVLVPIGFTARFLRRISEDVRRHLWRTLLNVRIGVPVVLEALAVVMLAAGSFAPQPSRPTFAVGAAVVAITGYLWLLFEALIRARRSGRTRPIGGAPTQ